MKFINALVVKLVDTKDLKAEGQKLKLKNNHNSNKFFLYHLIVKKIFLFLLTFFFFTQSSFAILKVTKLPYKDAQIERIYKLDNGKYIFIEQWGRGDVIWEYDPLKDKFKEISKVWTFIEFATKCEMIDSENIYFANSLEYWFAGGNNIDYPEIRIFELYEPKPWRDTDIGIAPDMDYAKKYCTIVKPYYIK